MRPDIRYMYSDFYKIEFIIDVVRPSFTESQISTEMFAYPISHFMISKISLQNLFAETV